MSANFASVDPGQRTGVAVWDSGSTPLTVDLIRSGHKPKVAWELRCEGMGESLLGLLRRWSVSVVHCELPALMEGERGHATAAKGDLVKLSYLVGVYAGMCHAHQIDFHTVPVGKWKGQLPKKIVAARIRKRIGDSALDEMEFHGDIWDAVGIGLYVKGNF